MNDEKKMRFAADRPKACAYCYWWQGRVKGCELGGEEQCYYRLPDEPVEKKKSKCDGCPYGRPTPCIGYCIRDLCRKEQGTPWKDNR